MSAYIDWSTTEGCDQCNEHGPFLPGGDNARNLHQAWHAIVVPLFAPVRRLMNTLSGTR